jgi:hypothetical protein
MYMFSYVVFGTFVIMRLFYKKRTGQAMLRTGFMSLLLLVGLVDLMLVLSNKTDSADLARMINVFFIMIFIRSLRETWGKIFNVCGRSLPLWMIILTFMLFFVFMGFILFSQNEESSDFDSLLNSWFNIFVLFTLANYPDIQIPYYANNRLSFFYFLFFIVIGLYLFLNFLLAVIFNTYKALQTHETEKYEKKVDKFFNDLFDEMCQSQLEESITLNDLLHALGGRVALKKDERMKKIIF